MTGTVDPRDALAWRRHLGDVTRPDLQDVLRSGSIADLATALPERGGGRLAVGDEGVAYADLPLRLRRAAAQLARRLPSGPERRVLLLMPSSLDLVLLYLAAASSGTTVVFANPTSTAVEVEALLRASRAGLVVADPGLRDRVAGAGVDVVEPGELLRSGSQDEVPLAASSEDLAILAYTSGTTGAPKAVPLRHRHVLASIRAAAWAWRIVERDHIVHALPLFHQHGLSAVHAGLVTGCSVTVAPAFGPDLLPLIRKVGASILFAVPSMYQRLLDDVGFTAEALPGLRLAVSGSSPLPPGLFDRIERRLLMAPLERYGTTESGLDLSNPLDGPRLPGSVGFPLPGVEMRLMRDDGQESADGEPGEICVRGPQVVEEYLDDPVATAEATWPDGWFRTGDIGTRAPSGAISIVGRRKELIISGGMNVYPAEVEAVLAAHPDVDEVAVAGRPSERWGEEVVAYVVPSGAVDPAEVVAYGRERLAPYKCPKEVVLVETLPRNAMGKVLRSALLARPGD